MTSEPVLARIGPEQAAELRAVVLAAFAARPPLDPPADALAESEESLAAALRAGGLIARLEGEPVGGLVFDPAGDLLFVRRFGVRPEHQGHGLAHRLVRACLPFAAGYRALAVLAREELPRNIGFWNDVGFTEVDRRPPYVELHRAVPASVEAVDADAMRALGARLGATLRAGDLVVLSGELGAGKTTFTQGVAEGLGVRGSVTSPTFVIARVHPSLCSGPDLVHVDAYRLGGLAELDDLDLDTSLDTAVTVVEWGAGLADVLAERRLEVRISRALGAADDAPEPGGADPRLVTFHRV